MKHTLIVCLVVSLLALAVGTFDTNPVWAAYNDVTFSEETPIHIDALNIDLRVVAGGEVASTTVTSNSVSFGMESGSHVTVRSYDRRVLGSDIGSTVCTVNKSETSLTSTQTETLTLTPTSETCTVYTVLSGGGYYAPPAAEPASTSTSSAATSTASTATSTTAAPASSAPVASPSPSAIVLPQFTVRLMVGSEGNDVRRIQQMLVDEGVYPEAKITGYFGALTKAAVQRFQEKYGIAGPGIPGYGDVGPATRAKLNEITSGTPSIPAAATTSDVAILQAQVEALQQQLIVLLAQLAAQLQSQVQQ